MPKPCHSRGDHPPLLANMVKKQTAEQVLLKAREMQARASKMAAAGKVLEVNDIMKRYPHLVGDILKFPKELSNLPVDADLGPKPPIAEARGCPTSESELSLALARPIDRQNYKLKMLPVKDMKMLLYQCNKVAFTPWNLKSLLKKGQREVSKSSLCQVIGYISGVSEDSDMSGGFFATIGDLATHLQKLSRLRGDRGASLVMPPDWPKVGVYTIIERTEEQLVLRKIGNETLVVINPSPWQFSDSSKVYIDTNWSDARASLKALGDTTGLMCSVAFANAGAPLAITDGFSTPSARLKRSASPASSQLQGGIPKTFRPGAISVGAGGSTTSSGSSALTSPGLAEEESLGPSSFGRGTSSDSLGLVADSPLVQEGGGRPC